MLPAAPKKTHLFLDTPLEESVEKERAKRADILLVSAYRSPPAGQLHVGI